MDVESKIILGKEVQKIDYTSDSIVVKCSDGSVFEADNVIVTVSLGVLKERHDTIFKPSLPAFKVEAIKGLSFGTVDKIFLEFEKPFWNEDWSGFSILWTEKDLKEMRDKGKGWMTDIFGFYKVDFMDNILCGWIGGPSARTMETCDDKTVMDACLYIFERFLTKQIQWTTPINVLRSTWHSNPHFRGSYSFRSLTTDALKTSASELAKPIFNKFNKPQILFAGEATSDHYYSTVHGGT